MYDDACVKSRGRDNKAMNANLKFFVVVPALGIDVPGNIRMNWCEENFGELFNKWACTEQTKPGSVCFMFEKEEDAVLFALKWAGQ